MAARHAEIHPLKIIAGTDESMMKLKAAQATFAMAPFSLLSF